MASEAHLLGPCGTYCGLCPFYTKEKTSYCPGCGIQQGHLFWGKCKLYSCAKEHTVEHCGVCNDFPCDLYIDQYDPSHGQKSAILRAGLLAYRRRAGRAKYLDMIKKIGQT